MVLRNYPSHFHLKNRFFEICGHHVGILKSQIIMAAKSLNFPDISLFVNSMPAYHKLLIGENAEMSYHLSGYGIYREEALIRLLGEGIERYALVVAPALYKDKFVYATYNEIKTRGDVVPWEYIKIYSDEDYLELEKVTSIKNITKDDLIAWLKCPSLFDGNREIYVPVQVLFTGYQPGKIQKDCSFAFGFSKGTSTHTDIKKALKGAILEAVESDATMVRWYTKMKSRRVIIDDPTLLSIISEILGEFSYEIIAYHYNLPDMPGHSFGLVLLNKKEESPFVLLGCQAGLDPIKTLYRAFLESLGILYLATYGGLYMPQDYLETTGSKRHTNLDSNVAFFSDTVDTDKIRELFNSMYDGEVVLSGLQDLSYGDDDRDIEYLLTNLRKVSEYGVYLDITPPETARKGWKVIRTLFPELLQISLPDFPYTSHPRMKQYGGIQNEYPHPLP